MIALSLEELRYNKDLFRAYFTHYVEKNRGLEHKGGVASGGTFVVVYESGSNPVVVADFALPYLHCIPVEPAIQDLYLHSEYYDTNGKPVRDLLRVFKNKEEQPVYLGHRLDFFDKCC